MKDKAIFILSGLTLEEEICFKIGAFSYRIAKLTRDIEELVGFIDRNEKTFLCIEGASSKEDFLEMAQDIKNLLSLAVGKRIIFNKQFYYDKTNLESISRKMAASINEGQPIIPNSNIDKYLLQVLNRYSSFSKGDKSQFFACTDYLNQTKDGFIEDRVLHTAIAWESLAEYLKVKSELPTHLLELRSLIKTTLSGWRTKNTDNDSNGDLGSRILAAIDREKLLDKLLNLSTQFHLNYSLLSIDFYKLKELRNSVAHSGRISISGSEAYGIMEPAIRGLQIILLTWIGYSGLINSHRAGWKTIESINTFYVQT
jgi:hypothetical protein